MIVGICKIDIVLGGHSSLKQKRQVIRKIKDSVFSRFKVSISEVGYNDLWQRAELGFALVGNSKPTMNSLMDKIVNLIFDKSSGHIVDKKSEFIHYED